jgi:hypothetical protein
MVSSFWPAAMSELVYPGFPGLAQELPRNNARRQEEQ